jgi:hypothetical protein
MNCVSCFVKPSAYNGWVAQIGNQEFGPYLTCDMALKVAITDALARRKSGCPACVVVTDADGTVRAKRCLCADFMP